MAKKNYIKIGPHKYEKIYSDNLTDEYAHISQSELKIVIAKDLPKSLELVALIHEIIHGVLYSLGHTNHDELLVDGLANGFYQVLKDNPNLLD